MEREEGRCREETEGEGRREERAGGEGKWRGDRRRGCLEAVSRALGLAVCGVRHWGRGAEEEKKKKGIIGVFL